MIRSAPFSFSVEEIVTEPDRCAYKLVSWVYRSFGFGPDDLLREIDRCSGGLEIPD